MGKHRVLYFSRTPISQSGETHICRTSTIGVYGRLTYIKKATVLKDRSPTLMDTVPKVCLSVDLLFEKPFAKLLMYFTLSSAIEFDL